MNSSTALMNASHLYEKLLASKIHHDNNDTGNRSISNNHTNMSNNNKSNKNTNNDSKDDHKVCAGLLMMS